MLRSAAAAAALTAWPDTHLARDVWSRVLHLAVTPARPGAPALVIALADTLLPRTDTPGALDVNAPAFVDVIVLEYYTEEERAEFLAGLEAIDAMSVTVAGAAFASLDASAREPVMQALEDPAQRTTPAGRTYSRLRGLIVHGYFTSERVQREVLQVDVIPGRFDGSAPLHVRERSGVRRG